MLTTGVKGDRRMDGWMGKGGFFGAAFCGLRACVAKDDSDEAVVAVCFCPSFYLW